MRFRHITKILVGVATTAALAASPVAIATVDMFIKIDNIPGDSKAEGHVGEIDIHSFSWGESKSTKPDCVALSDISITKFVDISTPALIQALATGQPAIPKAKLSVRKLGAPPGAGDFLIIEMSNVTVSSVQTSGHGADDINENVTLSFSSLKFSWSPEGNPPISGVTARTCAK